jgi:hypothetical protein
MCLTFYWFKILWSDPWIIPDVSVGSCNKASDPLLHRGNVEND